MSRTRTAVANSAPPRARARKVWTPAMVAEVCGYIEDHLDIASSCEKAGASYEGLRDAMATDPEIAEAVRRSQATSTHALVTHALASTGADAKTALWLIERHQRERYKPPKAEVESKNEHTGKDGASLPAQVIVVTEEQMLAAASRKLENT